MSNKLPPNFLKEVNERDRKYITVYDTYTPNYKRSAITPKFYSRYEGIAEGEYPELLQKIYASIDSGPREKFERPITANQCYGWYIDKVVELDRSDRRLYCPRTHTEISKHGVKLLSSKGGR